MKTISEIKQEYQKEIKRHDDKIDKLECCNIVKSIKYKRTIIVDVFDEYYEFPGGVIADFDLSNADAKFATIVNKKGKSQVKSYEWIDLNILVIADGLGLSDFGYFHLLKENQEFKKMIDEYNNFIDEIRG